MEWFSSGIASVCGGFRGGFCGGFCGIFFRGWLKSFTKLLWSLQEITPTRYNVIFDGAILYDNVVGAKLNGGKGRWAEPEKGEGDVFMGTAGGVGEESSVVIFLRYLRYCFVKMVIYVSGTSLQNRRDCGVQDCGHPS